MTYLKILEWNINQRAHETRNQEYIGTEILRKDPDVAILLEFKGEENEKLIKRHLNDTYYLYHYFGVSYNKNNESNGVLIALKKSILQVEKDKDGHEIEPKVSRMDAQQCFENYESIKNNITVCSCVEEFKKYQPEWLKVKFTLKNGKTISVVGVRINSGGVIDKTSLKFRKKQIELLLSILESKSPYQIIAGDFNYGPHIDDYDTTLAKHDDDRINWQDIVNLIRKYKYSKSTKDNSINSSPYSPSGTSFQDRTLDWLITKKVKSVSVIKNSNYNMLDWSFGRYNRGFYDSGYLVPEGYFIRNTPGNPDHAIFTAEVEIDDEITSDKK